MSAGSQSNPPHRPAVSPKQPDWDNVRRVLVIRLRSIGDAVLATPALKALRRSLPNARIDFLLEDWVAPLFEGFEEADNIISIGTDSASRWRTALSLRQNRYDVVFNLHGGSTSSFLALATGARHRIGYPYYRYAFMQNLRLRAAEDFWGAPNRHSAEQQLALAGFVGIDVDGSLWPQLPLNDRAAKSLESKFEAAIGAPLPQSFALIHPAAAFATKQWAAEKFARVAEYLAERGIEIVAAASAAETAVLRALADAANVPIAAFDNLTLPEIAVLASRAKIFIGNDSGIAHIAAAVKTPSVVIFGSSNRNHWRPWTDAPNEIVFEEFPCQPCPGYVCNEFGEPRCILSVRETAVTDAVGRVLKKAGMN